MDRPEKRRTLRRFAVMATLLAAPAAHGVDIDLGCAWLDAKGTEGGTLKLRDVDVLGGSSQAVFVWDTASNQWQLDSYGAESWGAVLARVESVNMFDALDGATTQFRRWRVFGRQVTGASVTTPGAESFDLAFARLLGCTRRLEMKDFAGPPAAGIHQFSIQYNGAPLTRSVTVDQPLLPSLVVNQQSRVGDSLVLAVEPVTGFGPVKYMFRVYNVEIGEFIYEQVSANASLTTPPLSLAPGERYRVFLNAFTVSEADERAWSLYKGPIATW